MIDQLWKFAESAIGGSACRPSAKKGSEQVRKLVCVGTLEERIDGMIEQKKELAERIVGKLVWDAGSEPMLTKVALHDSANRWAGERAHSLQR